MTRAEADAVAEKIYKMQQALHQHKGDQVELDFTQIPLGRKEKG